MSKYIGRLFFWPPGIYDLSDSNIINIDSHLAYYSRGNSDDKNKVLLIAHGNAGHICGSQHIIDYIRRKHDIDYDIIVAEYPGFCGLKGKADPDSCVDEIHYWYKKLSNEYEQVNLYGQSIGSGVIMDMIYKHNLDVDTVYLHSPFMSVRDVVQSMNSLLYFVCCLFPGTNFLDSYSKIDRIKCNNLIIMHSENDEVVPYFHGTELYEKAKKNKQIKYSTFIDLHGGHNDLL